MLGVTEKFENYFFQMKPLLMFLRQLLTALADQLLYIVRCLNRTLADCFHQQDFCLKLFQPLDFHSVSKFQTQAILTLIPTNRSD